MSKSKKKKTCAAKKIRAGNERHKKITKRTGKPLDNLLTAVRTHPDDIAARLDLAEYYLNNGQAQNIGEALRSLQDRYPFADRNERGRYNFLAGCGHLHRKQLSEAEEVGQQGLKEYPDSLDFLCLLADVHLALREHDKVIKYASRFIELCEQTGEKLSISDFCNSFNKVAHMCNSLGTAYKETGQVERAEEYYRRAISSDPGENQPYLNLIRLLKTTGKAEEAKSIIEKGVSACRQVLELRMLKSSLNKSVTVSACLMVKNEEELLPGCLESIRDWVDEIIVVDTGSTDKTVAIAESYGAKIYHQPWENDFSKHRNHTIELATSDWVCIIDADERFDQNDIPQLLKLINNPENSIVSVSVFNRYKGTHDYVMGSNSIRFWRRSLDLRYEGIVHNALIIPDDSQITQAPICLEHIGYDLTPEKMEVKYQRTRDLLQKQLDENPKNCNAWFNVVQLLRGKLRENPHEFADEAIDAAMRAIEYSDPNVTSVRGVHLMSHNHVAAISFLINDLDQAEEYAKRALGHKPDYLDPLMLLAMIHNQRGDHEQAIETYQSYLDTQADFDKQEDSSSLILYYSRSRDAALYGMGQAALALEDSTRAKQYFRMVLDLTPDYADTALQLGHLYLIENHLSEAQEQFENQLNGNRPLGLVAAGLGYICSQRGESEEAAKRYRQAIELEPENPIILGKCGVFFREINEPEKAATYIEKSLAIDDSQTVLKRHLGELRFAAGRYEDAMQLLQEILEVEGDLPDILNDLGNCCFKMNQLDAAVEHYSKASQCSEPPAFVFRNLGIAYAALHKAKQACNALVTYSKLEPEDKDLASLLGDLYLERLMYQPALEQYEKFLLSRPNDVLGIYKLSECYRAMGHSDSAAMGYRRVLQLDPDFTPAREKLADPATSVTT